MHPPTILGDLLEFVAHTLGDVLTIFPGPSKKSGSGWTVGLWIGLAIVFVVAIGLVLALA